MDATEIDQANDRRKFLRTAAVIAASATTVSAFAAKDEHHHHHQTHANATLIDAALDCVKNGEICQDHCIRLIKDGDTSIADCLSAVNDMLPACSTLAKLAISESKHLKQYAEVCIAICKDCEKECEKHKDKHHACKACMESCAQCIKACEKISA
jgi:Cys-rich four helix bundle protein (predicted Tat secretion target)